MKVYLAARNKEKAEAALERLESDGTDPGNGVVTFMELNLDNHRSAKSAAEEFLNQEDRLDILGTLHDTSSRFVLVLICLWPCSQQCSTVKLLFQRNWELLNLRRHLSLKV